MGCGASRSTAITSLNTEYVQVTQAWDRAWHDMGIKRGTKVKMKNLVVRRSGWKTIRIFVSSTFRDFHQEREILVKKVFPDLRLWCEELRLQLIECDLRWGVPKDDDDESKLRACLGEIDRCYDDNVMPFFVNMTSERVGWVPTTDQIPEAVMDEFKWIEGLSVTEMEIMHAAYRVDNPNALFMLRDNSFLKDVPEEYQKWFVESDPVMHAKLEVLRKMIKERFPSKRICEYEAEYRGYNPDNNMVELGKLEDKFSKTVLEFFKERISAQYPMPDSKPDPFLHTKEQHESFMNSRSQSVFGRTDILQQMDTYVTQPAQDVPFMLIGDAGSGKSSIMARLAEELTLKAVQDKIPGDNKKGWLVFYHFVGAVPGSTELEPLLRRLLVEMGICKKSELPKDLSDAAGKCNAALNSPLSRPTIIIIDALNQLDNDREAQMVNWVPNKLAPQIRCLFSMIPNTPQYESLMGREPVPRSLTVTPLDRRTREIIVTEMLGKWNKRLDSEQMDCLLEKSSSANPLWLSMAVEELRVFGLFRKILDKVNQLADGLLEIEIQIIDRFERESNPILLVATLCLMEVSSRGLLEVELLSMLANEDSLAMPDVGGDEDKDADTEKGEKKKETSEAVGNLPAYKWADVYRNLKPFLRPFGDSGEGRLDFYHRSLSKSVRRKYFKDENGEDRPEVYKWWHTKLADFFEVTTNKGRKLEEYPVHLMAIGDHERLTDYLTQWETFDALFDEDYSSRLVTLWRTSVGFETMEELYMTALRNFANAGKNTENTATTGREVHQRKIKICRFFAQAGRYNMAQRLVEEALRVEKEEFDGKDENMAELYQLYATVLDEIMKMEEYMYRSQLPRMKTIIDNFELAASLRKKLPGDRHKKMLGKIKNRLSFYYSGFKLRGGDGWLSAPNAQEKALASVEEAIEIFTQLKDKVNLADCFTTKGVTFGHAVPEQLKCYKEAEEVLLATVGEHHALDRLYLNMGIHYEESGNYYAAFEYFHKWYELSITVYGQEHPRALRSINVLREPMYRRILMEKGIPVPDLPTDK